jgi:FkbM family methyltransferase
MIWAMDQKEHILNERIRITTSCRDCDYIPKVKNAGYLVKPQGNGRSYQIMHNGMKVYTDSHYGDFNSEVIRHLKGHHEPQEEKVFYEVLKKIGTNGVMIELGSFWAYYSMWFNKSIHGARNYMIEPMEPMLRLGMDNFKLNGIRGNFIQACVGKESQEQKNFQHWDGTIHNIPQIAIDNFLEKYKLEFIDILHADIQGAEYEMLQGGENSLSKGKIRFLFISTHGEGLHRTCLHFLKNKNYKVIAAYSPLESYSVDGLIAVCHEDIDCPSVFISKRRYHKFQTQLIKMLKKVYAKSTLFSQSQFTTGLVFLI